MTAHCPSGPWRQGQPCPVLPAERGEQLLELSLTLTRRLCTLSSPGAPCTKAAAGGGAGLREGRWCCPALPAWPGPGLSWVQEKDVASRGAVASLVPGPLATAVCGPWEGQWRGFGHPVRELPWTLLSTLASSRVTPHGTRSPGPSEAQPRALGEARCPAGREAGWCSPRRVRERRLRAACRMFSRGFSISALLTPRDGGSWWGHLSWASQDGRLHPGPCPLDAGSPLGAQVMTATHPSRRHQMPLGAESPWPQTAGLHTFSPPGP